MDKSKYRNKGKIKYKIMQLREWFDVGKRIRKLHSSLPIQIQKNKQTNKTIKKQKAMPNIEETEDKEKKNNKEIQKAACNIHSLFSTIHHTGYILVLHFSP